MQRLLRISLLSNCNRIGKTGSAVLMRGHFFPSCPVKQKDTRRLQAQIKHNSNSPGEIRVSAKPNIRQVTNDDFQVVFKFPYIVHIRVLCRLKIYQTAFTLLIVPGMLVAYIYGMSTVTQCQYAVAIASLACGVLYVVSGFFRRFIGIIYINRNRDTAKVAHLTFWGNRKDVTLPIQDIVSFNEVTENKSTNLYHKLKSYNSNDEYFYYVTRFGGVVNPEQFQLILGDEVPYPKFTK